MTVAELISQLCVFDGSLPVLVENAVAGYDDGAAFGLCLAKPTYGPGLAGAWTGVLADMAAKGTPVDAVAILATEPDIQAGEAIA